MLSAFAMGVYYAIEAVEYNANTRNYPKTDGPLPHVMPAYWSLQMGASTLFLFVFPMMLFIFYHKLEGYIRLQRQEKPEKAAGKDLQGWCLFLFLLQALSNVSSNTHFTQTSSTCTSTLTPKTMTITEWITQSMSTPAISKQPPSYRW